ncbi:hypothetical protein QE152_g10563 [Popillia japonica]|uniref:Uncharacterized protein n=1 Tax=Popillia japonica TaxID=7064 RepID=A0AAW1LUD3_POPJA
MVKKFNVAKYLNDQLPNDEEEVAAEDHDGEEVVEDNDELNNDRQRGQQRREEIKNIIFQLQFSNCSNNTSRWSSVLDKLEVSSVSLNLVLLVTGDLSGKGRT